MQALPRLHMAGKGNNRAPNPVGILVFLWERKLCSQDYVNWIVRDLNQPEMAELDNSDRLTTPRLANYFYHFLCQFVFLEKSS